MPTIRVVDAGETPEPARRTTRTPRGQNGAGDLGFEATLWRAADALRGNLESAEAGAVPSVGSRGNSYDNALAESFNGLYKTELIRHAGPWQGLDDVEYATLEYVDWFNHRRPHGESGMVPPAEFEATYYLTPAPALLASSQ